MNKIPVDYDDFVRHYRGVITGAGVSEREVERVAFTLWVDHKLKDFRLESPTQVTCDETLAYLGIPFTTWRSFIMGCRHHTRSCSNFLPAVVEGGLLTRGPYLFVDIERIFQHRDVCFPKYAAEAKRWTKRSFAPSVEPQPKLSFEVLLQKALTSHLEDPKDSLFEIPDGLPQNNSEVYAQYQKLVANVVYQRIKFGIHPDDAQSEVWAKLLSSDIIRKFIQSGTQRLPVTMTSDEAKDFLGVTDSSWRQMMKSHDRAPMPVRGDYRNPDARYKTSDILQLDQAKYFRRRPLPRRLPPDAVSRQRLDGYVRLATVRAILNIFRHLSRHSNPESTLQGVHLVQNSCGTHQVQLNHLEDTPPWEDSLVSDLPQQDEVCDALRLAKALGVEHGTSEYYAAIKTVVERAERRGINFRDLSPEVGMSLVSSLVRGSSLATEARQELIQLRQKRLLCQQQQQA